MDASGEEINYDAIVESTEYDYSQLPQENCFYCGNHNPLTIAKCQCGRWFCNSNGVLHNGSHIFHHLIEASHNSIENHPDNTTQIGIYKCSLCNNNHALNLEIIPDGSILCRRCCMQYRENNNGIECYELFEGRRAHPTKIQIPSQEDDKRARKITNQHIRIIEKNIINGKNPFDGLENTKEFAPPIPKIKLRYNSIREYYDIYVNMLRVDMNYKQKSSEEFKSSPLSIAINQKLGTFEYDPLNNHHKLRLGTLIEIFINKKQYDAIVANANRNGSIITIQIFTHENFAKDKYEFYFKIKFLAVPYERMLDGLRKFLNGSINKKLKNIILGNINQSALKNTLAIESAPNLPILNSSQQDCINTALTQRISLIQGPPGAGKTHILATLVYNLLKTLSKKGKNKILICSSSNVAVDNIVSRIDKIGIKVVKVCSKIRQKLKTNIDHLCLHTLTRKYFEKHFSESIHVYEMAVDYNEVVTSEWSKKFYRQMDEAVKNILSTFQVICTTCITSFDNRLDNYNFEYVLIDEANQSTETETLLPLLKGCKQVILVGDHMQLGPITECRATAQAGLTRSLFSRLVHMGMSPFLLDTQYRMHPSISAFPKAFFYNHLLLDGITHDDRFKLSTQDLWPNNIPHIFLHHKNGEGVAGSGKSFVNPSEAFIVKQVIDKLITRKVNIKNISILTPYLGQKQYLLEMDENYNAYTIDEFQGSENDYIIFSTVRSNETNIIGFLNDFRRMNVGITRAKYGMVIIGDAELLMRSNLWAHLISHYSINNLLFTGNFGNLNPFSIECPLLTAYDFRQDFPYAK